MKSLEARVKKLELKHADGTKVYLLFRNGICTTSGEFEGMSIDEVEELHSTHHLLNFIVLPKGENRYEKH